MCPYFFIRGRGTTQGGQIKKREDGSDKQKTTEVRFVLGGGFAGILNLPKAFGELSDLNINSLRRSPTLIPSCGSGIGVPGGRAMVRFSSTASGDIALASRQSEPNQLRCGVRLHVCRFERFDGQSTRRVETKSVCLVRCVLALRCTRLVENASDSSSSPFCNQWLTR
jgi:hypothetical protein